MIGADGLVLIWRQDICNHHADYVIRPMNAHKTTPV